MNSQNNNNHIIAEKGSLDKKNNPDSIKYYLNVIEQIVQAVKDGTISIDDMQRDIKAALKTFKYYNEYMLALHARNIIAPLVQAVKDGTISIDDMQRGIIAPLKTYEYYEEQLNTFEYYNEHKNEADLRGCHLYPFFTFVRKERTEKE